MSIHESEKPLETQEANKAKETADLERDFVLLEDQGILSIFMSESEWQEFQKGQKEDQAVLSKVLFENLKEMPPEKRQAEFEDVFQRLKMFTSEFLKIAAITKFANALMNDVEELVDAVKNDKDHLEEKITERMKVKMGKILDLIDQGKFRIYVREDMLLAPPDGGPSQS